MCRAYAYNVHTNGVHTAYSHRVIYSTRVNVRSVYAYTMYTWYTCTLAVHTYNVHTHAPINTCGVHARTGTCTADTPTWWKALLHSIQELPVLCK